MKVSSLPGTNNSNNTAFFSSDRVRALLRVLQVFDMKGVQRARFCHNRKESEDTYLPADDVLYRLNNGAPWHGRLDLSGWGVYDDDMPGIATVSDGVIRLRKPK